MNELDLLRELRSEVAAGTAADLSRGRAALVKEIGGGRVERAVVIRRPVRVAWFAAGLAAALALAVLATLGLDGAPSGSPVAGGRSSGAQPSGQPPASLGGREASRTVTGPEAVRAIQVAALTALQQRDLSPRPDQFVFIDSVHLTPGSFGGGYEGQVWLSADGTRGCSARTLTLDGKVVPPPPPPSLVPVPGPSGSSGVMRLLVPAKRAPQVYCTKDPAYHADLPTTGDAMLAYLTKLARDRRPDVAPYAGLLLTIAGEILENQYLRPASLSALFEALKVTPGLSVGLGLVDSLGRPGISINFDINGLGDRVEFMFDPDTYEYHGVRFVYLADGDGHRKGDIESESVVKRLAIVDRMGQLP
jgi:hypothetical protein